MKAALKRLLLPKGRKLRRIKAGIGRGRLMQLDLSHQLQRYVGLDERELSPWLDRLMGDARAAVDIGANDGLYTMALLASRAERIVACEPGSVTEQLLANALANGHRPSTRFQLERRLVGDGVGEVLLSDLLRDLPRPILIKLDVDGGERHVLESCNACEHLEEVAWLVETHSVALEQACLDWFAERNYRTKIVYPAWWRCIVPERRPLEQNRWVIALGSQLGDQFRL